MEKRLFLTGDIGCGKSTALKHALGEEILRAGGFLTVRRFDEAGNFLGYTIERPDGSHARWFIRKTPEGRVKDLNAFRELGMILLREAVKYPFIVLDEIGGMEMLCPEFSEALYDVLRSGVPCIGVMKGRAAAAHMLHKNGGEGDFLPAAEELRKYIAEDPDTLLYECGMFDPRAVELAAEWAACYS